MAQWLRARVLLARAAFAWRVILPVVRAVFSSGLGRPDLQWRRTAPVSAHAGTGFAPDISVFVSTQLSVPDLAVEFSVLRRGLSGVGWRDPGAVPLERVRDPRPRHVVLVRAAGCDHDDHADPGAERAADLGAGRWRDAGDARAACTGRRVTGTGHDQAAAWNIGPAGAARGRVLADPGGRLRDRDLVGDRQRSDLRVGVVGRMGGWLVLSASATT